VEAASESSGGRAMASRRGRACPLTPRCPACERMAWTNGLDKWP